MKFSLIALASVAAAAPALEGRWGWGSCPADSQYECTTNGLLNVLDCISVLDGNSVTLSLGSVSVGLPISLGLKKRWESTPTPTPTWGKSTPTPTPTPTWGKSSPTPASSSPAPTSTSGSTPYCCVTSGLINVLDCVNLLDGNTIVVSL